MDRINVGFIGCGRIADLHVPGYAEEKRARLYAVCDADATVAAQRCSEWGAEKQYTDYRDMLSDAVVDAVEILTPQLLHESMAIEALEAGKDVAVQKPITVDLKSADRMIEAAARTNRVFKITENYVFYPPIALVKKLLDEGAIGRPQGIRIKMLGGNTGGWEVPASAFQWRIKEASEGRGFAAFDHGHHLWSTAWYLMGRVERVVAWIDSCDGIVDCPSVVMWKYADGPRYGVCDLMHGTELRVPSKYYSNDEWIEVTGSKGLIHIHRCTGNVHKGPAVSLFDGHQWRTFEDVDSDWASGFTGATRNFIDAIEGVAEPLLSGDQAREILRFALALQRSAKVRREVFLEEMDSPVPVLYAASRRAREMLSVGSEKLLSVLGFDQDVSDFAPQAVSLTEQFVERFDPGAAAGVDTVIGLCLTLDNGVEEQFGLRIGNGKVSLTRGRVPDDALLTVWMPAGLWAAILLKKQRVETALFQGKIRFEGRAEEAVKLRNVFKL